MPHSLTTFLMSSALAAIIYICTRLALGARADRLIGGASVMVFFVTPWWAAIAGAIFGHALAVSVLYGLVKEKAPRIGTGVGNLAVYSLGVYALSFMLNANVVVSQSLDSQREANDNAWTTFAAESDANRFVAETYQPCLIKQSSPIFRSSTENNLVVCRASTIAIANTKGHEFAQAIDGAILSWHSKGYTADEIQAKLDAMYVSL